MRIGLTYTVRSGGAAPNRQRPMVAEPVPGAMLDNAGDLEEEFDSPETVAAIAHCLESLGHQTVLLGDGPELLRSLLKGPRPDLVFNFAEGRQAGRCREARVPAVLEMFEIPYTGSDPLTLAVTLDKACAKRLVKSAGVHTPHGVLVEGDVAAVDEQLLALVPPLIVKPAYEGSSKGIVDASLVRAHEDLPAAVRKFRQAYQQPILVEEFIDGDELTVGVVGNGPPRILGIMRVLPKTSSKSRPFIYDLATKRDYLRRVTYECPARLDDVVTDRIEQATLAAWKVLGCRDVGRFDFRLRDGVPYFLECNPLPGLSPESGDLVILSRLVGIGHADLVRAIVDAATTRLGLAAPVAATI